MLNLVLERAWVNGDNMMALLIRPKYLIWVRDGLKDRAGEPIEPAQFPEFLQKKVTFDCSKVTAAGATGVIHAAVTTAS